VLEAFPDLIQEVDEADTPQPHGIAKFVSLTKDRRDYSKENLYEHLVDYCVVTATAPNAVTDRHFRKLVSFLSPRAGLDLPSAPTLAKRKTLRYELKRAQLATRLSKAPFKLSLVVDGWTNRKFQGFFGT
jgi:hypothetical protein